MLRRTGLVMIVALAALTMYPPPAQVGEIKGTEVTMPAPAAAKAPLPSVTLQHQLIQIEPAPRPRPTLRLRRQLPATRLASASGPIRTDSLVARARRAVVGDGRFRPEPFPRLDR
jgi:hypothetical protein